VQTTQIPSENNPCSRRKKKGAFRLTYDSSDEEDDCFDLEQETRRAKRVLEQDIDEKL
jgi:hypothetical protein